MSLITHLRRLLRLAGAAVITAILVSACGSSASSNSRQGASPSASGATSATTASAAAGPVRSIRVTVGITNFAYRPARIVVTPGTKVTFTNHDQTAHTATTLKRGFDTGTIGPGKTVTVSLPKPGTYPYMCQFHAFMRGTMTVRGN